MCFFRKVYRLNAVLITLSSNLLRSLLDAFRSYRASPDLNLSHAFRWSSECLHRVHLALFVAVIFNLLELSVPDVQVWCKCICGFVFTPCNTASGSQTLFFQLVSIFLWKFYVCSTSACSITASRILRAVCWWCIFAEFYHVSWFCWSPSSFRLSDHFCLRPRPWDCWPAYSERQCAEKRSPMFQHEAPF